MRTKDVEARIAGLDAGRAAKYEEYFATLFPSGPREAFLRWMFAYASVHTTWKANCKLYEALKGLDWLGDHHRLLNLIRDSRAGMHNNRAFYITQFSQFYWKHPDWFRRMPGEAWLAYRDRIMSKAIGLGVAKTSFALELTHFHHADVACMDTHMLQLYGFEPGNIGQGKVPPSAAAAMEVHWVGACRSRGLSPVTARWMFWDQKQMQLTPLYWSYTLHTNATAKFNWT